MQNIYLGKFGSIYFGPLVNFSTHLKGLFYVFGPSTTGIICNFITCHQVHVHVFSYVHINTSHIFWFYVVPWNSANASGLLP